MVGGGGVQLKQNSQIESSMRKLKAMGLNVNILSEGEHEAFIFITLDSIVRLIDSKMTYPNRKTYMEDKFLVINVWRAK